MKPIGIKRQRIILRELQYAIKHIESLLDTSKKSTCGVSPEHKEAVSLYVNSWILKPLERAIYEVKGYERTYRGEYRHPETGEYL